MSVNEAAREIGISASKLYQLVQAREIAHYRIGGKIVFSQADIDAYLASCHVDAALLVPTTARAPLKLKHLKLA